MQTPGRVSVLLPLGLALAALLLAVIVAYLVVAVLRRGRERGTVEAGGAAAPPAGGSARESAAEVRGAFGEAMRKLRAHVPDAAARHRVPWAMVLGEEGAGRTAILQAVGLAPAFPQPAEDPLARKAAVRLSFFEGGVALDVSGACVLRTDGGAPDDGAWGAILRQLRWHRPARPLDAVVLAIPAARLRGTATRNDAVVRGTALGARLAELQRRLGMRLPVYVVVTRCDEVPGFAALAGQVEPEARGEMLGWTSPHAPDAAFAPGWLDEAYESLADELYAVQAELLPDSPDPDGLFRFPDELRGTLPLLKTVLAEAFRESAYHEPYTFRGVYFTGAPVEAAAGEAARPVFVRDLFATRVFGERGLARPGPGVLRAGSRSVMLARAAIAAMVLLWVPAMAFSNARVVRAASAVDGGLGKIARDLAVVAREHPGSPAASAAVADLLTDMVSVDGGGLWAVALPTSWFSGLRGSVERVLHQAIGEVALPAAKRHLERETAAVFAGRGGPPARERFSSFTFTEAAPQAPGLAGEEAEVGVEGLLRELERMRTLSENVARYNRLATRGSGTVDDLRHLVHSVFGVELRHEERRTRRFAEHALRHVETDTLAARDHTREALRLSTDRMREVYDTLIRRVAALRDELDAAGYRREYRDGPSAFGASVELEALRRHLGAAEPEWLMPEGDLPPRLEEALDGIPRSGVVDGPRLGRELPDSFRAVRRAKLQELDAEVEGYAASDVGGGGTGADAGTAGPAAAGGTPALREAISALQRRGFVAAAAAPRPPAPGPPDGAGTRWAWDPAALDEALRLHADHQDFSAAVLDSLPPGARRIVKGLADLNLERALAGLHGRYRRPVPAALTYGAAGAERDLQARVAEARPAAERVGQVLATYQALGFGGPYRDLAAVAAGEAEAMLHEVDALAEAQGLYLPADPSLSAWRGERPVGPAVFETGGAEGLEAYLAEQRDRLRALAEGLAAPLLAAFNAPALAEWRAEAGTPEVVEKWSSILATLDGYAARQPGNALLALEELIRTGMDRVEPGTCASPGRPRGARERFFTARAERLGSALVERCRALTTDALEGGYAELGDRFNATLAGRFPFAPATAEEAADADPEDVRDFFRLYDRMPTVRQAVSSGSVGVGGPGSAVGEFLRALDEARPFLEAFLGADTTGSAAFRVTAEFRANRGAERGADQVAEWGIEVGATALTQRDSAGAGAEWRPGEAVRLTLRWATGSPLRPAPRGLPAGGRAHDLAATWHFGGSWALLRMIRQLEGTAGELGAAPGRVRHTLALRVPTLHGDAPGPEARAFVRLRLRHPGGREQALPAFPAHAPALDGRRGASPSWRTP